MTRSAPMPRKPKPPSCDDCYFRRNLLCALELDEPVHDVPAEPTRGPRTAAPAGPSHAPAPLGHPVPRRIIVNQVRVSGGTRRQPAYGYVLTMPERDLFANFARMRREMDQMLGDVWGRPAYASRRTTGFSPNVDVYYCGDPQRAVVKVDLAGVDLAKVGIEVSGRRLAIVGERAVQETEGRVYQQVEIASGPFRRIVELQVDVDPERAKATYEDGILRVDLPLRDPAETTRRVPIGRE